MIHASAPSPKTSRINASGELEFERKRERLKNGIPMSSAVYSELIDLGKRFSVEPSLV